MIIRPLDDVLLHWYGDSLMVLKDNYYYFLSSEEVFMLKCSIEARNYSILLKKVADLAEISLSDSKMCIDTFMDNYQYFFTIEDGSKGTSPISGEYGYSFPIVLHISLTSKCKLYCQHCYKSASTYGADINIQPMLSFLRKVEGKVPIIQLSGGEPTLYPHFNEILTFLSTRFHVSVLTSGYALSPDTINLIKNKSYNVQVSLYSSDPNIHNNFVKQTDAFTSTTNTIQRLCSTIPSRVVISTILRSTGEESLNEIRELIRFGKSMGVESFNIGSMAAIGRGNNIESHINFDTFLSYIRLLKAEYPTISIDSNLGNIANIDSMQCSAGVLIWALFEDGTIHPCAMYKYNETLAGNVQQSPYEIQSSMSQLIQDIRYNCNGLSMEAGSCIMSVF